MPETLCAVGSAAFAKFLNPSSGNLLFFRRLFYEHHSKHKMSLFSPNIYIIYG